MPSHWGHKRLNIVSQSSPTGTQCLHAIGTRGGRPAVRDGHRDRGSRVALPAPTKSSTSRSAKARRAKGSSGSRSTPRARSRLPVVYLIEDNGYAISVPVEVQTRRRRHLEAGRVVPGALRPEHRRHRLPRQLQGDGRGGGLRARAQGPGVRAREGDPPLLALAVGRREAVQDGGRARRGSQARSDYAARGVPRRRGASRAKPSSRRSSARSRTRSTPPPTPRSSPRSPRRDTATLYVYSPDVDPDVGRLRDRAGARRASPTRWSRPSTAR